MEEKMSPLRERNLKKDFGYTPNVDSNFASSQLQSSERPALSEVSQNNNQSKLPYEPETYSQNFVDQLKAYHKQEILRLQGSIDL